MSDADISCDESSPALSLEDMPSQDEIETEQSQDEMETAQSQDEMETAQSQDEMETPWDDEIETASEDDEIETPSEDEMGIPWGDEIWDDDEIETPSEDEMGIAWGDEIWDDYETETPWEDDEIEIPWGEDGMETPSHSSDSSSEDAPSQNEIETPSQNEIEAPSRSEIETPSQNRIETMSQNETVTPSQNEIGTSSQNGLETPSRPEMVTPSQNETEASSLNATYVDANHSKLVYNPDDFWRQVKVLKIVKKTEREVADMTRELVAGIVLSSHPNESVFLLALNVACQIRQPDRVSHLLIDPDDARMVVRRQRFVKYVVNPRWRIWEDENATTVQNLTGRKKALIKDVLAASDDQLLIWGPAFATILLNLESRSVQSVMNQLATLNAILSQTYDKEITCVARMHMNRQILAALHRQFYYRNDIKVFASTLFKGLILAEEKHGDTHNVRGLLQHLILGNLSHRGMKMISCVREASEVYGTTPRRLREVLNFGWMKTPWSVYFNMMEYVEKGQIRVGSATKALDGKWKYARVFRHDVFERLSYTENRKFCLFLALLVDYKSNPLICADKPGPMFSGLTKYRSTVDKNFTIPPEWIGMVAKAGSSILATE